MKSIGSLMKCDECAELPYLCERCKREWSTVIDLHGPLAKQRRELAYRARQAEVVGDAAGADAYLIAHEATALACRFVPGATVENIDEAVRLTLWAREAQDASIQRVCVEKDRDTFTHGFYDHGPHAP